MKFFTRFAALILVGTSWSAVADPVVTTYYCEVSASGVVMVAPVPTEVSINGSFTDDGTDYLFDWTHIAPGVSFESNFADPMGLSTTAGCRLNGAVTAELIGTGTFNGVPGSGFTMRIEDSRPAPDRLVVTASITRKPTRRSEGTMAFGTPTAIIVPSSIDVTAGASGHGWTRLHLDETITCRYRGTGSTYEFERCTDPHHMEYVPGAVIDVTSVRLRIQTADNGFDLTSVEAELGTVIPPFTTPDRYRISIFESAMPGAPLIYEVSGALSAGDIAITFLGPKPASP